MDICVCIAQFLCYPFETIDNWLAAAAAAASLQSCLTLCNPIDGSPPGSPIHGILQARILEWVTVCFSNAWKWKVKVKLLSHVWLLVIPWTAAYQAPPSMGFSRQEYWSGVPLPSPNWLDSSTNKKLKKNTCTSRAPSRMWEKTTTKNRRKYFSIMYLRKVWYPEYNVRLY